MKFEDIIKKAIDEKTLAESVFTPILESTTIKLPFVSTESRIAIERYLINLAKKDLEQVKLESEGLEKMHNKFYEEITTKKSENLNTTYEECIATISKIKKLLNNKLPEVDPSMTLEYQKYTLGSDLKKLKSKIGVLNICIDGITSCYKDAKGHLADAMSDNSEKGKRNINEKITGVTELFKEFKKEIDVETTTKKDVINDIWTNLLIDSISLLKMNDMREKVYIERANEKEKGNLKPIFDVFNQIRRTSSYGVEEIVRYFNDFVDYESVLYGINKYYRDHKKHVLQVWALGISLIHRMHENGNNIELNDKYQTKLTEFQFSPTNDINIKEKRVTKSELWAMWTIIALCHDLGYPIEKTSQINKQARKIISHFGNMQFTELGYNFSLLDTPLINKFLNIISSRVDICNSKEGVESVLSENIKHKTTVQEKYKDKLSKSLEDYKHGIFSSLLLFKNLTYFQETDYSSGNEGKPLSDEDARQFYIRKEILRSIAGHTCLKLYHIRLDTLAFLLILCDELQEWNRPRAENLLKLKKEEPPVVRLDECELGTGADVIKISMSYELDSTEDLVTHLVISRFKNIHYLLRSGKDDDDRTFKFTWTIVFKNETYELTYDSTKFSYELLTVERFTKSAPTDRELVSLYD